DPNVPISMTKQALHSSLTFDGRVVVITGSGTGIGQAIAKKFAERGASIIIMGRRKEPLDATTAILNEIIKNADSSGKVRSFPGVDVSDEEGITNMFKTIKKEFGKVDIVVNNAGVSGPVKTFPAQPYQEFKDCVAIHLTGTFWTSVQALQCMEQASKIITIATFFTEERPYEQRPYRFRSPYTAAQGAKNRLAEALAWELVPKGIRSISTNPGPVHSDRIYKTVYPKAAAEFVRIGGFQGLKATEIEKVTAKALPMLGEPDDAVNNVVQAVANDIAKERGGKEDVEKLAKTVKDCLAKMQEIAEKIQNNTSKMIVDGQFLSQEETADVVLTLADDNFSRLINGRVIPADRVFYPVKPLIACSVTMDGKTDLKDKVAILTVTSTSKKDHDRVKEIASAFVNAGAKCVLLFSKDNDATKLTDFKNFHFHVVDLADQETIQKIFGVAKDKFGRPDTVVHITGDYDYNQDLTQLTRKQWDGLVDKYINIPALIAKEAINSMVPGALVEPSKYKDSKGTIIIIGPDAPSGKKVAGLIRARAEVFRGALRPFTATVNQELSEVLNSLIRVYLILPGNIEGMEADIKKLANTSLYFASGRGQGRTEVIYYPDETKAIQ
ncbi:MAG TPA: SDR family oxidoreductase, partial [Nitrososphaerales archaeon]|nr:SDR family oxidoreductase [Nitrososphaerales archaeon]